ncbi:MAG TPA: hypothetical protein VHO48_10125, partial [Anaerolineaceae bacterium]|nr:hypothetical protein [Anaerolineaceae bacterium]
MSRLIDPVLFALERLWQHRALVFWTLVGLSAATTLALSLTLYVDAVNTDLLTAQLSDPPYSFRFRYLGSWEGTIDAAKVEQATQTIEGTFTEEIGLPTTRTAQFVSGGNWNISRQGEVAAAFGTYALGMLDGADPQIQITAGEWPVSQTDNEAIPVLMAEKLLYQTGLQVGDMLTATKPGSSQPLTLKIVALWSPVDSTDPSWILTPKFFDNVFLMQPQQFATAHAPAAQRHIFLLLATHQHRG